MYLIEVFFRKTSKNGPTGGISSATRAQRPTTAGASCPKLVTKECGGYDNRGRIATTERKEVLQLETSQRVFQLSHVLISFTDEDYPKGTVCQSGPLTVQLDIVGQDVKKVLIENGSSVDIIFRHALRRMILEGRVENDNAEDIRSPLYGFGNNAIPIQGTIDLSTTFDTYPQEVTALVKYYIIDIASSYNVIIGRPTLFFVGEIISTPHMKVKFLAALGPGSLKSDSEAS